MTDIQLHPARRAVLAGAAALPLVTISPAYAAEFEPCDAPPADPTHPVNIRAQEA